MTSFGKNTLTPWKPTTLRAPIRNSCDVLMCRSYPLTNNLMNLNKSRSKKNSLSQDPLVEGKCLLPQCPKVAQHSLHASQSACLPAVHPPFFLHACLPACMHAFLPSCLPSSLSSCLPVFLPAWPAATSREQSRRAGCRAPCMPAVAGELLLLAAHRDYCRGLEGAYRETHMGCRGLQSWKKRVLRVLQNPTFIRFCAISVLFSAKFYQILQNVSNFTKFSQKFTNKYQIDQQIVFFFFPTLGD